MSKYREENDKLYKQNELLSKDLNILHQKLALIEQTHPEALSMQKDENDTLKMKIFALEQSLIRKDNLILQLKKKSYQKDDDFGYIEREIYITEPSKAIVYINDELLMYKDIYENLISHIKEAKESLLKSEALVIELQRENSRLNLKFKYQQICATREKETLRNAVQQERSLSNTRNVTDKSNKSVLSTNNPHYKNVMLTDDNNLLYKKIRLNNANDKYADKDFNDIIKQAGLRQSEYEKLSKTTSCAKLIEIIEMMYSLITDKKMTINVLKQENEKLTTKNFQLNKDNMVLFQQNVEFKQQLMNNISNNNNQDKASNNGSLINNTSQITTNLQINNALMTYHKLIKKEEKNGDNSDAFEQEESAIDSSRHDSIIYIKNIKEEPITEVPKSIVNKKINDDNINEDHQINNKNNLMTIESMTSSEFRDGCYGINSFVITIRENDQSSKDQVADNKLSNVDIKPTNL